MVIVLRTSNFSPQGSPSYRATTDASGNYHITDVPLGSYQLSPIAPGYVSGNQKVVIVGEGEAVADFDFALVRGGVVTGRVTDADGRPVIEERVYLLAADTAPQPGMMSEPSAGTTTDDRGIYRMFGIKDGRYRVAVGKSDRSFFDSVTIGRKLYQQTFHPDVSDPTKATVVVVGERGK